MATDRPSAYLLLRSLNLYKPGLAAAAELIRQASRDAVARGLTADEFLDGGMMALVQFAGIGESAARGRFAADMEEWAAALRTGRPLILPSDEP